MRYSEILDHAKEPRADRLARLALMYAVDESDAHEQEAQIELTRAKAEKLRVDASLAVAKVEREETSFLV